MIVVFPGFGADGAPNLAALADGNLALGEDATIFGTGLAGC